MSIKPTPDGRWRVVVWSTDADGIRKKRERVAESQEEAIELEARFIDERNGVTDEAEAPGQPGYSPTFATFARRWFLNYAKCNNKRSHWTKQQETLQRYLVPRFGRTRMKDIKAGDIEKFRRYLVANRTPAGRQRRPGTINRIMACLRKLLATACDWGVIETNPMRLVKQLREDPAEMQFLTRIEIPKFLEALPAKVRPVAVLAIQTGLRQGELFGLRWEDIDWEGNRIRVTRSRSKMGVEDTLKTKKSRRQLPMSRDVRALLLGMAGESAKTGWLIADLTLSEIRKGFAQANRSWGGGKHIRFHDLRHTFASHLVLSGCDLITVMTLMGHSNLAMVARYSHLSDQHRVDAISNTWDGGATSCENGALQNSPVRGRKHGGQKLTDEGGNDENR